MKNQEKDRQNEIGQNEDSLNEIRPGKPVPVKGPDRSLPRGQFLEEFLLSRGITAKEIADYREWGGLCCWDGESDPPDDEFIRYSEERAAVLLAYRDVSPEDLERDIELAPWAWPSAMAFERVSDPPYFEAEDYSAGPVWRCFYEGRAYYYGIGKPETPITDDMRKKGGWSVYTFTD